MGRQLPAGRVTFAFTDVVGSTRAFTRFGDTYVAALRRMHEAIAAGVALHGGAVVSTEGDGAFLAFATAAGAVDALVDLQERFEAAARRTEPDQPTLRIRAGAHSGQAVPLGDEYVSLVVHHAARVAATAGPGQLIVSDAVQQELPGTRGERLGAFELKDVPDPMVLWRVVGDATPPRANPARRTNVAVARTSFVGRDRELQQLGELLAGPGIVTLTGPGGLGKTRLVSEFAHAALDDWPGGVWLAELASVTSPDHVGDAVAAAVGVEAGSVAALAGELDRRGRSLLVLDGCEHVVDAVATLCAELQDRCAQLHVVCTSREPLDVDGEIVVRLRPLGTGPDGAAERLFAERAATAGAALTAADLPLVSRICQRLDALPLALELAAARAPNMPLADLAAALEAGELHLQRRSGQPHQRNLRDLVSWSLERLGPGERTALLALSVFPGRFGTADAKRLLAEVPDADGAALPELVRRSLADLDGKRYRLLRVIRDAAREELGARPELDTAAQQALLQWALDGCPPATERRFGDPDDFDSALAVEAALRWGLAAGRPGLHPLMRRLRRWSQETCDSAGVRELAREVLARPVPETSDEVILQAMAAEVATGLGWTTLEETATVERARRLVELARAGGDPQARYEASSAAAMALSKAGCPAEALACALEALELTEGVPQLRSWRAIELGNLALLHYVAGDLERAEAAMREALVAHEQDGDRINAAVNRCNLGELLLDRGDAPAAEEQLRAALRSADGVRAPTGVAMALLVEALTARGATAEAGELAREAVPALEQLAAGDPSMAAQLERLRGVVAALPGH